ncbi:MAG: response regulator transcription factor [Chitinophagales bacterium]|nr:response regulator transcription factor [Chitinophagales bacterium]MDW8272890.1 response regulator transcription factor [Chitinophagales bacterium]
MKIRVLLAEDEESLRDVISMNLEMEGYEVVCAKDGSEALKKYNEQHFHLIILDVMMPEVSGFEVCEKIRLLDVDTPILFLTAKDSHIDKVKGLKIGADDYLTKPFNLEELLLRVRVLAKHSLRGTKEEIQLKTYAFGGNEINFVTFKARLANGKEIELTKKEASLLKLLIDKKNTVVSRHQILNYVWGYDVYPTTRTIDNFITSFRKYFEPDPRNPIYFHSVRGVGYKFTDNGSH